MAAWLAGQFLVWSPAGRRTVRRGVFRRWARGTLHVLGVRLRVDGPVPAAPFVLVSNHLGYLDIVTCAARLPTIFVAKAEVRRWPVVGLLARAMGTIFIDRTASRDTLRVLERITTAVQQGDGVTIFAEATSSAGEAVLPFRPALLAWAATSRTPVHFASLSYRTPPGSPPAHLSVCWWGEMSFGPHLVSLAQLPRIDCTLRVGAEPITDPDRKRLAHRLHRAVSAQFIPVLRE